MRVKDLHFGLLAFLTVSLSGCGGGSSSGDGGGGTVDEVPFFVDAPIVLSANLPGVSSVNVDAIDPTGAWRVTSSASDVEIRGTVGSVTTELVAVSHFYQQSIIDPNASDLLFGDCIDTFIDQTVSFSDRLANIRRSNRSQVDCSGVTTTEIFQDGNKIAYEYFCSGDNRRARTVLIERVSDIPNIGFGQSEITIEGEALARSNQACSIASVLAISKAPRLDDQEAQLGFIQLLLPTNDGVAILNLSVLNEDIVPSTVRIGDDGIEAELLALGFDESKASRGTISLTSLNERRVEVSFDLQFNDDNGVSRDVRGNAQINL